MATYTHTLTETETACGVTLEQVAHELTRVLVRGDRVYIAGTVGPALAGSVARCAFAGPVDFIGINTLGLLMYGPAAPAKKSPCYCDSAYHPAGH